MTIRPNFPDYIDNVMRVSFANCPRKFYYRHLRHLEVTKLSIDLTAGCAFAAGLACYRLSYYYENKSKEESLKNAIIEVIKCWGSYDSSDNETKSLWNVMLAVEEYFNKWEVDEDFIKPIDHKTLLGAETGFSIDLDINHPETGLPIKYCGRIDMVGKWGDSIYVVDEKTTTTMGNYWASKWDLQSQFLGYCWALGEKGVDVKGYIIRGIAIRKRGFDFGSILKEVQSWEIERWKNQLNRDINNMIRMWEEGYFDYNLSDSCGMYNGCPYKRLCEKEDPESWIEGNYIEKIWNPLHLAN